MKQARNFGNIAWSNVSSLSGQAARAFVVASLCAVLGVGPALAEVAPGTVGAVANPLPKPVVGATLTQEQRVLQALNRFTFGPRPGDVAAVEKMGLEKWFEQQLHPASISDTAFDEIMAKFPATALTTSEEMAAFPSGLMLKRYAFNAERALPPDASVEESAVYRVAGMRYEAAANGVGKADGKNGTVPVGSAAPAPNMTASNAAMGNSTAGDPSENEMAGDGMMNAQTPANVAPPLKQKHKAIKVKGEARKAQREDYTGPDRATILAMAPDARMNAILTQPAPQIIAFFKGMDAEQRGQLFAGLSPHQMETLTALQGPEKVVSAEALETRLLRDVYSQRQLQAVMTDFWLNHFSVYLRKNQFEPYFLNAYQKEAILPNALGNFEDLLVATAKSEAMQVYLDNYQSIGPNSPSALKQAANKANGTPNKKDRGINENYARELMELHTLGVRCEVSGDRTQAQLDPSCGKGYTQADVINVAKILSGWTVNKSHSAYAGGGFVFDASRHEPGPKTVLGVTIPEGGEQEGLTLLHMLATCPATAQFVSHKLAVRFVSDNPPRAIEDRMAKTFLATHGNIAAVMQTLFNSPEMWTPRSIARR